LLIIHSSPLHQQDNDGKNHNKGKNNHGEDK